MNPRFDLHEENLLTLKLQRTLERESLNSRGATLCISIHFRHLRANKSTKNIFFFYTVHSEIIVDENV